MALLGEGDYTKIDKSLQESVDNIIYRQKPKLNTKP